MLGAKIEEVVQGLGSGVIVLLVKVILTGKLLALFRDCQDFNMFHTVCKYEIYVGIINLEQILVF